VRDLIVQVLFTSPGSGSTVRSSARPEAIGLRANDALAAATQQLVRGRSALAAEVIAVERVTVLAVESRLEVTVTYVRRDNG
jgi:hypothetical protein